MKFHGLNSVNVHRQLQRLPLRRVENRQQKTIEFIRMQLSGFLQSKHAVSIAATCLIKIVGLSEALQRQQTRGRPMTGDRG